MNVMLTILLQALEKCSFDFLDLQTRRYRSFALLRRT